MPRRFLSLFAVIGCALGAQNSPVIKLQYLADKPPTLSSHASTIEETPQGMAAAWFGGTAERAKDVVIWFSKKPQHQWLKPVEVARGTEDAGAPQYACWNPVLWQQPGGSLWLFYKVGPSPDTWWGRVQESKDGGRTWSKSRRLPDGQVGPVRNKPVLLADGTLLCGASSEDAGWRLHMEWSKPPFTEWHRTGALNTADQWGAIQPTVLVWDGGRRIQSLVRTRQKVIAEHWSSDQGRTWTPLAKTSLPNPNSGIDAVRLRDGRALLVYNPLAENRSVIGLAISSDGKSWKHFADLESTQEPGKADLAHNPGELSYPAVVQARDGKVHITYTWKREKIRHVIVDPARIGN